MLSKLLYLETYRDCTIGHQHFRSLTISFLAFLPINTINMKSSAIFLAGAVIAGLSTAAPFVDTSHEHEVPYPPPRTTQKGQIMWALVRTRSVLDDGEIEPLNVWVPVSDDWEGLTIDSRRLFDFYSVLLVCFPSCSHFQLLFLLLFFHILLQSS